MIREFFLKSFLLLLFACFIPVGVCFAGAAEELEQGRSLLGAGDLEQARTAFDAITNNYPATEQAMWSQMELARLDIKEGVDASQSAGKLFADYNENPYIAHAVVEVGREYQRKKCYQEAIRLYETVLSNWPAREYALWATEGLASTKAATGDIDGAGALAERLIADFSDRPDVSLAVYGVADNLCRAKDYNKAKDLYNYVLTKNPEPKYAIWSRRGIAFCDIETGDFDAANQVVSGLILEFGSYQELAGTLRFIAQRFEKAGRQEDSDSAYGLLIQNFPDSREVSRLTLTTLENQARIMINNRQKAEAASTVNNIISNYSSDPDLPAGLFSIARKYEDMRDFSEAKSIYNTIFSIASYSWTNRQCQLGLRALDAIELAKINDYQGVNTTIDNILADFDGHITLARSVTLIAEEYYVKAREKEGAGLESEADDFYTKAVAIWQKSIEQAPNSPYKAHAYYSTAIIYHRQGKYTEALAYFDKVESDWPKFVYIWSIPYLRGMCYEGLARDGLMVKSIAESEMERACLITVNTFPNCDYYKPALQRLEQIYFKRRQWNKAAQCYEQFVSRFGANQTPSWMLYKFGQSLERAGRRAEAADVYRSYIARPDARTKWVKTIKRQFKDL